MIPHYEMPDIGMYALVYAEINIFCMVLLGLIISRSQHSSMRLPYQKDLNLAMLSAMVLFGSDTLIFFIEQKLFPFTGWVYLLLKDIYFTAVTLLGFFWFVYCRKITDQRAVRHPEKVKLYAIPVWIELLLLAVNWFVPFIFGIEEGRYTRMRFFLLTYLFACIYVIAASVLTFQASRKEENYADQGTLRAYTLFPLAPCAAGIVQYFYPQLPVLCCAVTFIIEYIVSRAVSMLISMDHLTQLNNRRQFTIELQKAIAAYDGQEKLAVMFMDVDWFKEINDQYGHLEGDQALLMTARAITNVCEKTGGRAHAGRYGGDEFVLFVTSRKENVEKELIDAIRTEVQRLCTEAHKPYHLQVSIGCVMYAEGMSAAEVIDRADRRLYEVKKLHHTMREN